MTFPTIHEFKKALQTCKGETEAKRASILARLAEKGPVSAEEEAWLDEAGNRHREARVSIRFWSRFQESRYEPEARI